MDVCVQDALPAPRPSQTLPGLQSQLSPFAESHPKRTGEGGARLHPPVRRGRAHMAEEEEPGTTDLAGSCWNSVRQPWLQVVLVESLTFLAPEQFFLQVTPFPAPSLCPTSLHTHPSPSAAASRGPADNCRFPFFCCFLPRFGQRCIFFPSFCSDARIPSRSLSVPPEKPQSTAETKPSPRAEQKQLHVTSGFGCDAGGGGTASDPKAGAGEGA